LSQKRAIFRQFFTFLKAHSGATQLKKDEKMAEKSLFGPSDQIANKLLDLSIWQKVLFTAEFVLFYKSLYRLLGVLQLQHFKTFIVRKLGLPAVSRGCRVQITTCCKNTGCYCCFIVPVFVQTFFPAWDTLLPMPSTGPLFFCLRCIAGSSLVFSSKYIFNVQ
jgi:hypothetical protein